MRKFKRRKPIHQPNPHNRGLTSTGHFFLNLFIAVATLAVALSLMVVGMAAVEVLCK